MKRVVSFKHSKSNLNNSKKNKRAAIFILILFLLAIVSIGIYVYRNKINSQDDGVLLSPEEGTCSGTPRCSLVPTSSWLGGCMSGANSYLSSVCDMGYPGCNTKFTSSCTNALNSSSCKMVGCTWTETNPLIAQVGCLSGSGTCSGTNSYTCIGIPQSFCSDYYLRQCKWNSALSKCEVKPCSEIIDSSTCTNNGCVWGGCKNSIVDYNSGLVSYTNTCNIENGKNMLYIWSEYENSGMPSLTTYYCESCSNGVGKNCREDI